MSSETNFQQVLPTWLELASKTDVSLGLDPSEAFQRAERLLNDLRSGQSPTESWAPKPDQVEILHALVALVCREGDDPKAALRDIELVFDFISALPWPAEDFGGPRELLANCAFQAWRVARRFAPYAEVQKLARRLLAASDARTHPEQFLSIPVVRNQTVGFADPEFLQCVCETLSSRLENAPAKVREVADLLYNLVEESAPAICIQDERDYFLGEFALMAGAACRFLYRMDDAENWFRRAEGSFSLTLHARAHAARVAYQRLALCAEERRFDEILDQAPLWASTFSQLEMPEDSLKCRFLEGVARWETGDSRKGIEIHQSVRSGAAALGSSRLVAQAATNLARYHDAVGETDEALRYAREALPMLKQVGNRVHLVNLRWNIGDLLRRQNKKVAALEAYRQAQAEARDLGLRGDLASLHLVVGDLLLEEGQDAQAEREIRAALPIIEEEKMVPEGIAALSLLRESLRRRQIDHGALRDLHRHLEKDRPR